MNGLLDLNQFHRMHHQERGRFGPALCRADDNWRYDVLRATRNFWLFIQAVARNHAKAIASTRNTVNVISIEPTTATLLETNCARPGSLARAI